MEVAARPTLTPRDQTWNYAENEFPTSLSRALSWFSSNYVRFGSSAGKQRPENVGGGVVVRLLAVYGGLALCDGAVVLAVGWRLCTAVLMWYFDVAVLTSRTRWIAAARVFDFQPSIFIFWHRVVKSFVFSEPEKRRGTCLGEGPIGALDRLTSIFGFDCRFCLDKPWERTAWWTGKTTAVVLRGTIVNRTYGTHKNLDVYLFLLTILGSIYHGPPVIVFSSLWTLLALQSRSGHELLRISVIWPQNWTAVFPEKIVCPLGSAGCPIYIPRHIYIYVYIR